MSEHRVPVSHREWSFLVRVAGPRPVVMDLDGRWPVVVVRGVQDVWVLRALRSLAALRAILGHMVTSDALTGMYVEILNGVPKARSRFAGASVEAGESWDRIAAEVAQIKREHPGAGFDIPSEIPAAI